MMCNHDRHHIAPRRTAMNILPCTTKTTSYRMMAICIFALITTSQHHVGAFTTSRAGGRIRTERQPLSSSHIPFHLSTKSDYSSKNVFALPPSSSKSALSLLIPKDQEDQHGLGYKNEQKLKEVVVPTKEKDTVQGVHPFLKQPFSKVKHWIQQTSGSVSQSRHKVTTVIMAAFIMLSVMFTPLSEALAAPSGGRMGGSFGGSTRSSTSRSYSSPSRSRAPLPSSSSYGQGFSRGYSTGYYSRPSITVAPIFSPSPYSYGYGPGGMTVVRRGPSVVDVVLFGVVAAVMYNAFTSSVSDSDTDTDSVTSVLGPGVSVAQISVALNVPDRDDSSSILSYLDRLSRTARTDSRVGVSNLVSQVALELLRQRRSAFAAGSKYTHYRNANKANRDFSSLAIQERSKFETEDISNYGGVEYGISRDTNGRKQLTASSSSFSPKATSAVVTIILSIDGDSTKLPTINSVADLERALTQIASDVKVDNCLRSAEVLWTPQSSGDTLSERDIIADYPNLRSV
mmetsp:Transcript_20200/g.30315  ORF Transcript_20200/g.30315 Transcript_20200/m.30315 type:complete len:513 (-) Transcript_20200:199-1737(-)